MTTKNNTIPPNLRRLGQGETAHRDDYILLQGERFVQMHWLPEEGELIHHEDDNEYFTQATMFAEPHAARDFDHGTEVRTDVQTFSTGSTREVKTGKGRFDLIPYEGILELAQHYENGAAAHGDRNWEKGQPLSVYLSSMRRHAFQAGYKNDENHLAAVAWNAFAYIATRRWIKEGKLPKELDDVPVA